MMLALLVAASAPPLTAELQPLSFLVGHCWRGEFASRKHVDTHCFEPVFGGKFVRDRHEVTGGETVYRGETIYGWNAETRRVEYTYWSSDGGVSRGSMVPKDGALDFGDLVLECLRLFKERPQVLRLYRVALGWVLVD